MSMARAKLARMTVVRKWHIGVYCPTERVCGALLSELDRDRRFYTTTIMANCVNLYKLELAGKFFTASSAKNRSRAGINSASLKLEAAENPNYRFTMPPDVAQQRVLHS